MSRPHHAPHRAAPPSADGSIRRAPRRALASAVVAAALVVAAAPAAGQEPPPSDPSTPITATTEPAPPTDDELGIDDAPPPIGPLPEIADALDDVSLTSDAYDVVAAELEAIETARRDAVALVGTKDGEIAALEARDAELRAAIDEARARAERWERESRRLDQQVRAVAIDSYMRGDADDLGPLFQLDPDVHDRLATAAVVSSAVAQRQLRALEAARRQARRARSDETLSTAVRSGVRNALTEARRVRDDARADAERLAADLVEAEAAVEDERRLATVVGAGFPLVVLDAYFKATQLMRFLDPGCGIEWWALAGIGRVESGHGTHGGAEVRADGSLTRKIIGIPLTGANGTAAIGDSDGGLIDGDPTVDRAAGPMQFIPTTWVRWGRDGDGDGDVEIQNLYDAAAGAAAYLCASGPMTDLAGLQRGYFSYNHSTQYVYDVLSGAIRYGDEVRIEGVAPPPAPPPPPEEPSPEPDPEALADPAAPPSTPDDAATPDPTEPSASTASGG